jgi:hypothetical protein
MWQKCKNITFTIADPHGLFIIISLITKTVMKALSRMKASFARNLDSISPLQFSLTHFIEEISTLKPHNF